MWRIVLLSCLLSVADSTRADDWDDTVAAYRVILAKRPADRTPDEKTDLLRLGDRLYRRAKKEDKDPRAIETLLLLCEDRPLGAQAAGAIKVLKERTPDSPEWAKLCLAMVGTTWSDTDSILAEFAKNSPHAAVRAAALWSQSQRALASIVDIDPLEVSQVAAAQQSAMKSLATLVAIKEPAKVGNEDLRELAKGKLASLQQNALGVRAPEINGKDLQGETLTLTSFRGKVVVLVFWGAWCPICREQFPAEKELAKKYAGKPVALLGVNSDTERETAARLAKAESLAWPSFFDEGSTRGPIARQWAIEFWPTVILLDHRGVIRYRFQGMKKVDEAVALLLKEI